MILHIVPQQLIMAEKGTMGEYMYQICGAAILLLRLVQGMWNQSCRIVLLVDGPPTWLATHY